MRSKADDYGIDTDRIIASGSSAGAGATLFMSYAQNAQYEGDSGNLGFSSNPNGVIAMMGSLREELFCKIIDGEPTDCSISTGNDNTDDIGTFEDQPPIILLHGTDDRIVPYENGKAIYDRAQSVGLSSTLITIEGEGHGIGDVAIDDYFTEITTSLYKQVTQGAQAPEGCSLLSI